jgi:uncharacterized protein (TIGR00369 family)
VVSQESGDATGSANELLAGSLMERMGIRFDLAAPDRLVATMPVAGNTQPFGLLHGGASCLLAETVASVGAGLHAAPLGRTAVGVDLNATHHRTVAAGTVTATAEALSLGRTVACYEVVINDDLGRRVCTARVTCLLREPPAEYRTGSPSTPPVR